MVKHAFYEASEGEIVSSNVPWHKCERPAGPTGSHADEDETLEQSVSYQRKKIRAPKVLCSPRGNSGLRQLPPPAAVCDAERDAGTPAHRTPDGGRPSETVADVASPQLFVDVPSAPPTTTSRRSFRHIGGASKLAWMEPFRGSGSQQLAALGTRALAKEAFEEADPGWMPRKLDAPMVTTPRQRLLSSLPGKARFPSAPATRKSTTQRSSSTAGVNGKAANIRSISRAVKRLQADRLLLEGDSAETVKPDQFNNFVAPSAQPEVNAPAFQPRANCAARVEELNSFLRLPPPEANSAKRSPRATRLVVESLE